MIRAMLPLLLSLAAPCALAQDDAPAPRSGTSIVGERESPIGLYITPWRRAAPEAGIDRAARLLNEQVAPIDREVYRRQIEYHDALTQHRASTDTPNSPNTP